jgi:hypothetical protein
MTGRSTRLATLIGTVALAGIAALSHPAPVSACIGGVEFKWAIAHTRGWIATATVVEAAYSDLGPYRVVLEDVEPVKGSPPPLRQTTLAMGAICEQSPDAGERIVVLDDVATNRPYDTPIAYVIRGPDAVPAADVARAFHSLPDTDAEPDVAASPTRSWDRAPWLLLVVGVGGLSLAMRRFGRTDRASSNRRPDR